jgi:hypothetical protein
VSRQGAPGLLVGGIFVFVEAAMAVLLMGLSVVLVAVVDRLVGLDRSVSSPEH